MNKIIKNLQKIIVYNIKRKKNNNYKNLKNHIDFMKYVNTNILFYSFHDIDFYDNFFKNKSFQNSNITPESLIEALILYYKNCFSILKEPPITHSSSIFKNINKNIKDELYENSRIEIYKNILDTLKLNFNITYNI